MEIDATHTEHRQIETDLIDVVVGIIIAALEQQQRCYLELLSEKEKLFRSVAEKVLEIDATHTEHRQIETDLIDVVVGIIVEG